MKKIKTALLGSALAVAVSAPAMAEDFHALAGLQGATPLQDSVLAATEGGATCDINGANSDPAPSVALCSFVLRTPDAASLFTVASSITIGANFLGVSAP